MPQKRFLGSIGCWIGVLAVCTMRCSGSGTGPVGDPSSSPPPGGFFNPKISVDHQELAYRYAPIHYQDVDVTGSQGLDGLGDFITAFDFDGNFHGIDNWDNTPYYTLYAHAYYSVVETATHWFLVYAFFHPRDWVDNSYSGSHENDLEGLLVIVERPNAAHQSAFGELLGIVTVFHNHFFSFVPAGSRLQDGEEDIDGVLSFEDHDGALHPMTAQESKGHGLKAWPYVGSEDGDFRGGDGIRYYPSLTTAGVPRNANDRAVPYRLVDIHEPGGLWDRRFDPDTFADFGVFVGDDHNFWSGPNKAHAPWKWDDGDDGGAYDVPSGALALDPAWVMSVYFSGYGELDRAYTFNPYKDIEPPPGDTIVQLDPIPFFVPPHVGGDRDFHGNGPRVQLWADLRIEDDALEARIVMDALEWRDGQPKHDFTQSYGATDWVRVYTPPGGERVARVHADMNVYVAHVDDDHDVDALDGPPTSFVQRFEVVGDTKGDEAGSRTGVQVFFNQISVELE